jgi:GR25 family glycosyltransferase involved in LPS biosynthesis
MNDGIIYTYDVILHDSHAMTVLHRCVRKEVAEYLRDWYMAEEQNRFEDSKKVLTEKGVDVRLIERMRNGLDKFSVTESEVIL